MDFTFLDYIWRGLTVGTLSSAIVLSILCLTASVINKNASRQQMKYFFRAQVVLGLLVFVLSFSWVVCVDPELASGCFSAFAKDQNFFTLTRFFASFWLGGVVLLSAFDFFRIWKSNRVLYVEEDLQDVKLQKQFRDLVEIFKIQSPVSVKISGDGSSPFVHGLLNYQVVLPANLLTMNPESLGHIMAHELVHVRDKDAVWKLIELLGRRILFFNPFLYVLAKRHLLAIEMAADEQALGVANVRPKDYIETLIEVVTQNQVIVANPLALNASRTFKEAKERVEALVFLERQKPKKNLVNSVIFGSILISLGFSVAQARSTVQESLERTLQAEMMCSQVHYEKMIESWLRIPVEKNKCEE